MSLSILFLVGIITLNTILIIYWMENKITTGEVIQVYNTTFNVIMILWVAGDLMPQFFKSMGIASQALSVMHDPQDVIDPPHTPALTSQQRGNRFRKCLFPIWGQKIIR